MRKKNLSVKVAALAMSGTLAMAPMTVRADEVAGTTETAAPATSTTEESAAAGASTESTAPTTTAVEAAGTAATTAAPVTVVEPAADPGTTAPNNVNNVVKDDKQVTDISASFLFWGGTTKVTPNDVKEGKNLGRLEDAGVYEEAKRMKAQKIMTLRHHLLMR